MCLTTSFFAPTRGRPRRWLAIAVLLLCGATWASTVEAAGAPELIGPAPGNEGSIVTLPDGTVRFYYVVINERIESISSTDNGQSWSPPAVEYEFNKLRTHLACRALVDHAGEVHLFFVVWADHEVPQRGKRVLDVWHVRSRDGRQAWHEPKRAFIGYCGSIRGAVQLANGRIVVAIGVWNHSEPSKRSGPEGTGSNYVTTIHSDDDGVTWNTSPSVLTSPITSGYNGSNYGAIEPELLQLPDGRVWMVMRTQTGTLYESYSTDGEQWSPAQPTRFPSSNSPASVLRLRDDRLVIVWNSAEVPPRQAGMLYGGRDVLHAAISLDEGLSWQGFREILRDPRQNLRPRPRGDRGVAYPTVAESPDGTLVVVSGQGEGHRMLVRFSPDWLLEKTHATDFSQGLSDWSAFKEYGEKFGIFLPRRRGPELVADPDNAKRQVLHVRKPDEETADCATWNFPNGVRGTLTLDVRAQPGFEGADLLLADRFFNPNDPNGVTDAQFRVSLGDHDGALAIASDRWQQLKIHWDITRQHATVQRDQGPILTLPLANPTPNGISYLRLRADDGHVNPNGLLVRSAQVTVKDAGR